MVVARPIPRAGLDPLAAQFELDVGGLVLDRAALERRVAGAAALVADPSVPVDAKLLEAAGEELEVVANFAVGYDNVDLDECRRRQIVVTNTPDVLTNATAELTLALMLATARKLGEAERQLRSGDWAGWEPSGLLGRELAHSTIGIVGLGRIGTRVAELLGGFGARLLYASPSAKPELEGRLGLGRRTIEELVSECDIVTLHVSLVAETRHLVDSRLLSMFKRGSILINTTRGAVVDTAALIKTLRSGQIGGAGLDVYEHEPHVPPELLELDGVVLLPHVGSATKRTRDAMARLVAENVIAVLGAKPPRTPVVS